MNTEKHTDQILLYLAHLSDDVVGPRMQHGEPLAAIFSDGTFIEYLKQGQQIGLRPDQIIHNLSLRCGITHI